MTKDEALKLALHALEWNLPVVEDWGGKDNLSLQHKAITAIREALAQPYPDNFIDALMYDVAKRDSEAQQAYEDAIVGGTGVMLGGKRIDPASIYKEPEQEPVAFYVYKPTLPRGHLGNVSDGHLPWVYDQDPSSGYSARMLVYTTPPHRKPLTDEEIGRIAGDSLDAWSCARAIEAAHGIKENT